MTEENIDDDLIPKLDWDALSNNLSPNVLAALRTHLSDTELPRDENKSNKMAQDEYRPNHVFKLQSYWESRFSSEESYDWLISLANSQFRHKLLQLLSKESKILIVGCGNSSLSADLYDAGYHEITNIDFSETVIANMRVINEKDRPLMAWIVMDMTNMTFPPNTFDIVIDKAAMDALVVDEGDVWDPATHVINDCDRMCKSVDTILRKDVGRFIQISFAQPHFRTKYLMGYRADGVECSYYESQIGYSARYSWNLSFETLQPDNGCLETFIYVMNRNS